MQFKFLEIRDERTCISALAIQMQAENETQSYYLHQRCRYPRDGRPAIVLMHLHSQKATASPYDWALLMGDRRTMPISHRHIIEHFHELNDGDVVDVRVILGETKTPAVSERFEREDK